jgi:hypothetical protein
MHASPDKTRGSTWQTQAVLARRIAPPSQLPALGSFTYVETMRILHYCAHPGGFTYEWQHHHMIHELQTAGHDVITINPVETLGREADAATYSQVAIEQVTQHLKQGVDLFFAMATDDMITAAAIREISGKGIPTVNLSLQESE